MKGEMIYGTKEAEKLLKESKAEDLLRAVDARSMQCRNRKQKPGCGREYKI